MKKIGFYIQKNRFLKICRIHLLMCDKEVIEV